MSKMNISELNLIIKIYTRTENKISVKQLNKLLSKLILESNKNFTLYLEFILCNLASFYTHKHLDVFIRHLRKHIKTKYIITASYYAAVNNNIKNLEFLIDNYNIRLTNKYISDLLSFVSCKDNTDCIEYIINDLII